MNSPMEPVEPPAYGAPLLQHVHEPAAAQRLRMEEQEQSRLDLTELRATYTGPRWAWLVGETPRETQ
jgi:hypothetical protein